MVIGMAVATFSSIALAGKLAPAAVEPEATAELIDIIMVPSAIAANIAIAIKASLDKVDTGWETQLAAFVTLAHQFEASTVELSKKKRFMVPRRSIGLRNFAGCLESLAAASRPARITLDCCVLARFRY